MADAAVVGVTIDRSQHTVLVVDDNPATRYSTGRVLRAAGFKTEEAASGREAIALAQGNISAVVLDVHLPDIDGFEVCRTLRDIPDTAVLPIIHLSATYVEDEHKVEGLNAGADAYITHPAEPPILIATVQALVRARMAEDQLRRGEAKFRAIYTQAESGIALIDAEGRFVEANPAMLRMLGRTEAEVAGRRISEFASPEWQQGVRERIETGLAADMVGYDAFAISRPGGGEVHVEWSMSNVEPGLRVAIVSNISERRKLERQRQQLLEREQAGRIMAERHSQTKDNFIAVLSHELRNPLNAMLMGIHVLQRRGVTPDVARGLTMIEKNANTQARIISDILDVSRINSGKMTLDRDFVDPAALVTSSIEGMRAAWEKRQLHIAVDVDTAHEPVWLDGTRFQQIFWNIFNNAVKFSEPGGRIGVSLSRTADTLTLAVRDHGKGIEPEFLKTIFDKFAQGVGPENRAHGGLGLGMSIVKHLVELHGGTVKVESDGPGTGTTVLLNFPVAEPSAGGPASEFTDTGGNPDGGLEGVRVLVVEDDDQARDMLSIILRDRGAQVLTAGDYASAVAAVQDGAPAILVSDIGLPGKDGYDLIRELRRLEEAADIVRGDPRRLHAVALTAFGRPEDQALALRSGFDSHISKPLRPHELIATLARFERRRR